MFVEFLERPLIALLSGYVVTGCERMLRIEAQPKSFAFPNCIEDARHPGKAPSEVGSLTASYLKRDLRPQTFAGAMGLVD